MKSTRKTAAKPRAAKTQLIELPVLPLRNVVLFPHMMAPLVVHKAATTQMVEEAVLRQSSIGFLTQSAPEVEDPEAQELHRVGCTGDVVRVLKFPDHTQRILVQGVKRFRVVRFVTFEPHIVVEAELLEEPVDASPSLQNKAEALKQLFGRFNEATPNLPRDMDAALNNIATPGRMADFVASNLGIEINEQQLILEAMDLDARLDQVLAFLHKELSILELSAKIQKEVQEAMDKSQREYYLKEQIKVIRKELGELEGHSEEVDEFRQKITKAQMPPDVEKEARRELERMSKIHPEAAEYAIARTYLDWLCSLPWSVTTEDNPHFEEVQKTLDADHYGLEKVKERIVEYLAVRKLKKDPKGPILCLLGPPGVGKTSLGKSIARALGRKFERISLGGIRDEAEIRGHRRTYLGALPGRIIKAMKRAGTKNPVLVLDEIDKVGTDFRGDPSSALLEVLDPEQNSTFTDHYLDAPFDLSQVMFIATANLIDTIPSALKDRMEVIEIPGYIEEEKLAIARGYLLPKQVDEHGLTGEQVGIDDASLLEIIRHYTREAGVRGLERKIARILRKVAKEVALGSQERRSVTPELLEGLLGPQEYLPDLAERVAIPGVAIGLAWTAVGGDILFVEASRMKGKQGYKITGQLGDVMKESAEAALTWLRSNAERRGLDPVIFETLDLHVHVPAGATPKDGPSAGVTLLTALTSLLQGRLVRSDIAMTGEITLRGKVLPVGGVKEKVLAARRVGIREVILPARNKKDLQDIPAALQEGIQFHFVEYVEEVLEKVLLPPESRPASPAEALSEAAAVAAPSSAAGPQGAVIHSVHCRST